ncbi:glycoside hydrolase [Rhodotorula diobovata]|uniref:Glycoside hydrolase n=1 Tax=Rhodotorula diobovata TaxID=5288 RepID=A0A5C5G3V3_9BASI|nr:glycoside hydrolase [Rhodotorula diobovata]
MLSVGGWSGSNTFTGLVATDTARADFVSTLDTALNDYGFDGLDLDWEYPGKAGATNDFDVANDLNNYLDFFKSLREKIGNDKLISSDTSSGPWVGADGKPSSDLSGFGDVLDFITIMTYDAVTYSSTATGPNFAFDSSCAPSTQQFSFAASVQSWTDAKFPASKIMLGLASYGYAWKVAEFKDGGGVEGATSGIYQTATGTLSAADGSKSYDKIMSDKDMDYTFDDCSKTPFLYSSSSQMLITYDDPDSFAIKGAVAGNGLMGCSLYAALTQNKDGTLRDAAKKVC